LEKWSFLRVDNFTSSELSRQRMMVRELSKKRRFRANGEALLIGPRREIVAKVRNSLNVADILGTSSSVTSANGVHAKRAF
jgi:hypothetical protein